MHYNSPSIFVVVVFIELSTLNTWVFKLIPEGAKDSLKGVSHKNNCFSILRELWVLVPAIEITKFLSCQCICLAIKSFHGFFVVFTTWSKKKKFFQKKCWRGFKQWTVGEFMFFWANQILPYWSVGNTLRNKEFFHFLYFRIHCIEHIFVKEIFTTSCLQCGESLLLLILQHW